MADPHLDLPHGSLDLLILETLALECKLGWVAANWILQASFEALRIEQATLVSIFRRLERGGLITSRWERAGGNGHSKCYALTDAGQKRLEEMDANRQLMATAVSRPPEDG